MTTRSWITLLGLALSASAHPGQGFKVQRDARGVAWLVRPDGTKTWSFGVCVVDPGVKWEDYDENNPAYAAWRYYPSKPAWAKSALQTLRNGGFNTVGAWSDYQALLAVPGNDLYMTPIIHAGSSAGFPWLDMWDPSLVKVADDVTKSLILSLKNDPRIIGYFSDNELGWWKPAVWDWVWKQKTPYERQHVVAFLKASFKGDWQRFSREFDVVGATSWASLAHKGHPYLRSDCKGIHAIGSTLGFLANRYYSLCRNLVKKYAPSALYLGDRYISNYYPEVASAAGRYCDVVSTNLNPDFLDGTYAHFYLNSLEALTHKPLMITEYYMTSLEGRSGNGNDRSGFPVVRTLAERARGFERTTRALLADPNVVGGHWFQYYDEPKNGRGDGENYNFGLVDTSNQPYTELLACGKALDLYRLHAAATNAYIPEEALLTPGLLGGDDGSSMLIFGIPPSPFPLQIPERSQCIIKADQETPRGDLYVEQPETGLTVSMLWPEERFPENYFKAGKVPTSYLTTVTVKNLASGKVRTFTLPVPHGDSGYVRLDPGHPSPPNERSIARVGTATQFQFFLSKEWISPNLKAGDELRLEVTLSAEGHAYTTTWHLQQKYTPSPSI